MILNSSISFSRLSSYSQCPRKEYLESRLFFTRESNVFAIEGERLHAQEEERAVPNLVTFGNKMIERGLTNEKIAAILERNKLSEPNLTEQKIKSEKGIPVYVENKLTMKLTDDLSFTGIPDLYSVAGEVAFIVDYKFGLRVSPKYDQMRYYALLIKEKHPETKVFLCSFIYPNANAERNITIYEDELHTIKEKLIVKASDMVEDVKACAKPSALCDYCPFAEKCVSKQVNALIKLQNESDELIASGYPDSRIIAFYGENSLGLGKEKIELTGVDTKEVYFINSNSKKLREVVSLNEKAKEIVFLDKTAIKSVLGVENIPPVFESDGKKFYNLAHE